jgi:DNA polymerase (family 10)
MAAFLDACAQSGCAVELNANPHRLDLNERHLAMAKERGVLVSIAADAHSVDELDHLEYGVTIARRAGLTPDDVLNARPLEALREWLAARRARATKEMTAIGR